MAATGDAFDLLNLGNGEDVRAACVLEIALADERNKNSPLAVGMDAAASATLVEGGEEEWSAGGWLEDLPCPSARTVGLQESREGDW